MNIAYTNTESDIYSYGQLIYKKSPTVRQHRKRSMNFAALLSVIFTLIIYSVDSLNSVLIWLILAIAWLLYIPFQHKKRYLKNMIKTYQQEGHNQFFGIHSLTIDENGITDKIENGINITSWDKIEHIEEVDSHLFIFVQSALAYCIPKEQLSDNDCYEVITQLKKYRGANEIRSQK